MLRDRTNPETPTLDEIVQTTQAVRGGRPSTVAQVFVGAGTTVFDAVSDAVPLAVVPPVDGGAPAELVESAPAAAVEPVPVLVPEVVTPATVPGVTRFEVVRGETPFGNTAATV
jgi:hypothetical protein